MCVCVCVRVCVFWRLWGLSLQKDFFPNHKSLTVLRTVIVLPRLIHPKPLIHSMTLGYTLPFYSEPTVPCSRLVVSGDVYET